MSLPVPTLRMDTSGTAFGGTPTWTTYTSSLLLAGDGKPVSITWGRQDEQSEPQPRTCSFLLNNATGQWTPGNAAAPAGWRRGARVNVRLTVGASTYDRFDGYVESIVPTWPGGVQSWAVVEVTCTDISARLAKAQPLRSMVEQEILQDAPVAFWPLTEPSSSTSAGDISGFGAASLSPADSKYGPGTLELGADGPTSETTSARFVMGGTTTDDGKNTVLRADPALLPLAGPLTLECWFACDTRNDSPAGPPTYRNVFLFAGAGGGVSLNFGIGDSDNFNPGKLIADLSQPGVVGFSGVSSARVDDGLWHHVAVTLAADGVTWAMYVDGALASSGTLASALTMPTPSFLYVGGNLYGKPYQFPPATPFTGRLTMLAFHATALTATRILAHYQAGMAALVERSDQRYARIAGYGGVTTGTLPVGLSTVGVQTTTGATLTDALAKVARSEGTVSYVTGAGALTFQARNTRYTPTSTLALTADDIDGGVQFRYDGQGFANEATATRDGGATQRIVDTASQTLYGRADGGSLDVVSSTDYDAAQIAAWLVELHKDPSAVRVPNVTVDLLAQPSTTTVQNALAADISTVLTISALPSQAPTSSVSLFIEGGAEAIGPQEWTVTFNTSPPLAYTTLRADGSPSVRTKLDNGLKVPL